MKKYSRPLCLFLVLILSFCLFSVNAYAAEDTENLVDGNLSNWNDFSDIDENYSSFTTFQKVDDYWALGLKRDEIRSALIYSLPNLTVGSNYKLSFDLLISSSLLTKSTVLIGVTYLLNGEFQESNDTVLVFDNDLMNSSALTPNDWNTFTVDFKHNGSLGEPCIVIYQTCLDGSSTSSDVFYIRDVSLTLESTETEKKLDGILGWLQEIWDSITSLGDKLTDVWTNITSSVSALGDRISDFFSDLGNKITTEFTNLTSDFSGYISSLGDRISNYFTNLSVNINAFFDDLLEGIKEFFRGFGNLILYFNWDGEFENPFVYEHSLIGDFVGGSAGEDDEVEEKNENDNIYYLDNNKWSSNTTSITNVDGNQINFKNTSNAYFIVSYSDIPIKKNCKTIFHFSVLDFSFGSEVVFRWSTDVSGNSSMTSGERVIGKYTYNIEIPCFYYDETIDISFTDKYKGYSKDYLYIKDFYIEYVPIDGSSGSTGDTGSSEEGSGEKKSVSQFFDDLIEYLRGITDDIESVIDSITAPVTLLDEFTKRFEWLFGIVTFTLMMIVVSRFIGL